jgi:hypothetical protein
MIFKVIDIEHEYETRKIIKSVLRNEKGQSILRDELKDLVIDTQVRQQIEAVSETETVLPLPKIGEPCEQGVLYYEKIN